MSEQSKHKKLQLVLLGRPSVGKSTLTIMFIEKKYNDNYVPTITHTYNHEMIVDKSFYDLTVHDTAGLEEQSQIANKYLDSDGFILVYSITDIQRLFIPFYTSTFKLLAY
jgi:Ras family protein